MTRDTTFQELSDAGHFQVSHFSSQGRWKTVAQLTDPTGPFRLDFFRALQLRHFLRPIPLPSDASQPLTSIEDYCTAEGALPHALSLTVISL